MNSNLSDLFKQAQELQSKMNQILEQLRSERVEGTAGGGMVTATLNGLQEVIDIDIEPEVIDREEKEMLEEMIIAAINNGRQKAHELKVKKMSALTGGILPPNTLDVI